MSINRVENLLSGRFSSPSVGSYQRWTPGASRDSGFAEVTVADNDVRLEVDSIRSIPLFYAFDSEGVLIVGDQAHGVAKRIGAGISRQSAYELLYWGSVLGDRTIYAGVHQTQAGMSAVVKGGSNGWNVQQEVREEFFPSRTEREVIDRSRRVEEFGNVNATVFDHLVSTSPGSQFAVPLSGGLDSRLVLCSLLAAGATSVIAYTYGQIDSAESTISRRVAEKLGVPWHCVPYVPDSWTEVTHDAKFRQFIQHGGSGGSIAHVQDWLAVASLREQGLLSGDTIVVPGHSGDFLAGSHIAPPLIGAKSRLGVRTVREIHRRHGGVVPDRLARKLSSFQPTREIALDPCFRWQEAIAQAERWDWQARQARFVANSVRVYEAHSLRWALPQWDKRYVDFWSSASMSERLGCSLYREFCLKLFGDYGVREGLKAESVPSVWQAKGRNLMIRAARSTRLLSRSVGDEEFAWRSLRLDDTYPELSHCHVNASIAIRGLQSNLEEFGWDG